MSEDSQVPDGKQFESHRGSVFQLEHESTQIPCTLTKVEIRPAIANVEKIPFSLDFSAPAGTKLNQGNYSLVHAELGTLSLFLVPFGEDENGFYLCATIS